MNTISNLANSSLNNINYNQPQFTESYENSSDYEPYLSESLNSHSQNKDEVDPTSKKQGRWTLQEDEKLKQVVKIYGERQWRKIAAEMDGRTSIQCLHRWTKILKPGLVKGPWTQEEDDKLRQWIKQHSATKWAQCANFIQGRSGKQCRERWFNNLNPDVKKGNWTEEEDDEIFKLYLQYGSSWSKISKFLAGRTENAIKNRFYSTVRKIASDKKKILYGGANGMLDQKFDENIQKLIENHLQSQQKQKNPNNNLNTISEKMSEYSLKKKIKQIDEGLSENNQEFQQQRFLQVQNSQQFNEQNLLQVQKLSNNSNKSTKSKQNDKFNFKLTLKTNKFDSSSQLPADEYNLEMQTMMTEDNSILGKDENDIQFENLLNNISNTLQNQLAQNNNKQPNSVNQGNNFIDLQKQIFNYCNQNTNEIKKNEELETANYLNQMNQASYLQSCTHFNNFESDSQFQIKSEFNLFGQQPTFTLPNYQQQQLIPQTTQIFDAQKTVYIQPDNMTPNPQILHQHQMQQQLQQIYSKQQQQQFNQYNKEQVYENQNENQKMNYLLQQLNTLENMLSSTRKELLQLETQFNVNNLNENYIQSSTNAHMQEQHILQNQSNMNNLYFEAPQVQNIYPLDMQNMDNTINNNMTDPLVFNANKYSRNSFDATNLYSIENQAKKHIYGEECNFMDDQLHNLLDLQQNFIH